MDEIAAWVLDIATPSQGRQGHADEASQHTLDDPDRIYPGQVLRIPGA